MRVGYQVRAGVGRTMPRVQGGEYLYRSVGRVRSSVDTVDTCRIAVVMGVLMVMGVLGVLMVLVVLGM